MNQLPQEILNRLDALAAKLGVTLSQLWAILIHQAHIEVVTDLLEGGILLLVGGVSAYSLFRLLKKIKIFYATQNSYDDPVPEIIFAALSGVLAIGMLITGVATLFSSITPLFNPQYWAFKEIMSLLK